MTKGKYRVGINFNPSGDDLVGQIKKQAAKLIDLIETIPGSQERGMQGAEIGRAKSIAQTAIEDGAMWAVKAATKQEPN